MTEPQQQRPVDGTPPGVNPGYVLHQIAKALTTSEQHPEAETRERAKQRVDQWLTILESLLSGSAEYGSRAPVHGAPVWATLEVVTGGFATGELLAGGPLQEHERRLLGALGAAADAEPRRSLNANCLTDAGLARLQEVLASGRYDVAVPEEGALLVVAWMVENGHAEEARELVLLLAPYFTTLRFYPIPLDRPRRFGPLVHLRTAGRTLEDLRRIRANRQVQAQQEAVEIWAPFYDRVVSLFLETVENGWPCRIYPNRWPDRALGLLTEYAELRRQHSICGKTDRVKGHAAQLRAYLERCARSPEALSGREVGRIRLILQSHVAKHGTPGSPECAAKRRRQVADVGVPMRHRIAEVVALRFKTYVPEDGVSDVSGLQVPVTEEEGATSGVPRGTPVPPSILRKVERCLNETIEVLVDRGIIRSGETLAKVLPQLTSGLRAAGITDPALRRLYATIYRAFRQRRSLLLLNLERQVQLEELPWVRAIDRFRSESLSSRELARQTLEEITAVALRSFPQRILPNKLLQELRALVTGADLRIPLVDELAADIFRGEFAQKFVEAVTIAADLLDGSLYATYYAIDYGEVRRIVNSPPQVVRWMLWLRVETDATRFAKLCAARAGVSLHARAPSTIGMIIEQQQILTTQNLASLVAGLGLVQALSGDFPDMAMRCFRWICRRAQAKMDKRHARLLMVKNTAYAWRQMIFFLSLLPESGVAEFLRWADDHLGKQPEMFRNRFRPALSGLAVAVSGRSPATPFLGWTTSGHWLLAEEAQARARGGWRSVLGRW
jgi:hypothetical protein